MKQTKFEDYHVDELGNVYSTKRGEPRLLKQKPSNRGYMRVKVAGQMRSVHRLVYDTFIGIPDGMTVDHINGNKLDNRLCNLQHMTAEENTSKGNLGIPKPWENKPVEFDGMRFESIKQCANFLGVSEGTITGVLIGKSKGLRKYNGKTVRYL